MGFADLHLHSIYSADGTCSIEAILFKAQQRRLNVIAITDHNSMEGVSEAQHLMKKYQVQVIPAMEISTADGHLLAYEITEPVPRGLSLIQSILLVREQGGFCTVPHPMSFGSDAIQQQVLADALKDPAIANTILGIEEINGGLFRCNHRAVGLAKKHRLAAVGNSDSHCIDSVGRVVTRFDGTTIEDLKNSLLKQMTSAQWHYRMFDPLFYIVHLSYRTLGIAGIGVGLNQKNNKLQFNQIRNLKN